MFERSPKLKISVEELAVIEAALHTQSKILNMQASAGGDTARARLNEVKRLLSSLAQRKPAGKTNQTKAPFWGFRFPGLSRICG